MTSCQTIKSSSTNETWTTSTETGSVSTVKMEKQITLTTSVVGISGEYLLHWRTLTNHSQQGWEALNSAFNSLYHNRTQRGGAVNKGKGARSIARPMA